MEWGLIVFVGFMGVFIGIVLGAVLMSVIAAKENYRMEAIILRMQKELAKVKAVQYEKNVEENLRYQGSERCVVCGAAVPEGSEICPNCREDAKDLF